MSFRADFETTRGWLMEVQDRQTIEAYMEGERRRKLAADPDPKILSALVERGRLDP